MLADGKNVSCARTQEALNATERSFCFEG